MADHDDNNSEANRIQINNALSNKIREENLRYKNSIKENQAAIQSTEDTGKSQKGSNEAQTEWNKLLGMANQLEQHGYDNFISVMMSLFSLGLQRAHAYKASDLAGFTTGAAMDYLVDKAAGLGKKVKEKISPTPEPEPDPLPKIYQYVGMNDNNTIDFTEAKKHMVRSDRQPVTDEQFDIFKAGVITWVRTQGYQGVPNQPGKFVNNNGDELTKANFETLRDNPTTGLNKFLSGHFDMEMEQSPPVLRPR